MVPFILANEPPHTNAESACQLNRLSPVERQILTFALGNIRRRSPNANGAHRTPVQATRPKRSHSSDLLFARCSSRPNLTRAPHYTGHHSTWFDVNNVCYSITLSSCRAERNIVELSADRRPELPKAQIPTNWPSAIGHRRSLSCLFSLIQANKNKNTDAATIMTAPNHNEIIEPSIDYY